jgi:anti-sigma B factor antagonist
LLGSRSPASSATLPLSVDITSAERAGAHVLLLTGELDMAEVPRLEAAVDRVLGEGTTAITIDLRELEFIDSSGLAAIVHVSGLCAKRGYDFELVAGRPEVQRLFEITGLISVLPFRAAA